MVSRDGRRDGVPGMNVLIAISCATLGTSLLAPASSARFGLQMAALLMAGAALVAFAATPASFAEVMAIAAVGALSWIVAAPGRQSLETLLSLCVGFLAGAGVLRFSHLLAEEAGVVVIAGVALAAIALLALVFAVFLGGATAAGFAWLGLMLGAGALSGFGPWGLGSCLVVPATAVLDRRRPVMALGLLAVWAFIFLIWGNS